MYLLVVVLCCWLSGVGCQALIVDCRLSLSVIVVGSLLSGIGGRVLVVDCRCRLSLTFSIVGAQLCWSDSLCPREREEGVQVENSDRMAVERVDYSRCIERVWGTDTE